MVRTMVRTDHLGTLAEGEVTTNHDLSLTKTDHRKQITPFTINSICLASSRTFTKENPETKKKKKKRGEESRLSLLSDYLFTGDPPLVVRYPN